VLGLTIALSGMFNFGFMSPAMNGRSDHHTIDGVIVRLFGCVLATLLVLVVVTPLLINKKPVEFPPDYHPLFLSTSLNLVFLTGAIAGRLWLSAAIITGNTVVMSVFALRGGKALVGAETQRKGRRKNVEGRKEKSEFRSKKCQSRRGNL